MLAISGNARIFLYRDAVDMRKGFEGMGALVAGIAEELTGGTYFVFLNWKRDRIKVLYWDVDGLAIWCKRLEKGSFAKHSVSNEVLDRKTFFMLLEGITPKRIQKRFKI